MAVSGPFPATDGGVISAAYQWNQSSGGYSPVTLGQPLAAGTILWVKADADAILSVLGSYSDPAPQSLQPGGAYLPSAGLESWSPDPPDWVSTWQFDNSEAQWSDHLAGNLAALSGPPPTISPGQAVYVESGSPTLIAAPDAALRIRYYHEDHLGSSSVVTDASGSLVEETAFLPFGVPRIGFEPRRVHEPYQFTQKERDCETGLHYFGARYYAANIGRWLTSDPAGAVDSLNLYLYANNDPIRYLDPDGHQKLDADELKSVAGFVGCDVEGLDWEKMANAYADSADALGAACNIPTAPGKILDPDARTWHDQVASFFAGAGDFASFGLGSVIRNNTAGSEVVHKDSFAYGAGAVVGMLAPAGAANSARGIFRAPAMVETATGARLAAATADTAVAEVGNAATISPVGAAKTLPAAAVAKTAPAARPAVTAVTGDINAARIESARLATIRAHNEYVMSRVQAYTRANGGGAPLQLLEVWAREADALFYGAKWPVH